VLCLDRENGQIVHNVAVFEKLALGRLNAENSHATPTMVLDGDRAYAHFGGHGTACLSQTGEVLWTTQLKYFHHHGPASSPIVVDDLLIIACDGFPGPSYGFFLDGVHTYQFVAALDKHAGGIRWKQARQDGWHSYATPLAIEVNGAVQIVSPGANRVVAYEPATGEEIWWCRYKGYSLVPRPVFGHGLVYVCTGFDPPASLLAIRPDGQGDVTETKVVWRTQRNVPLCPSPLLVGEELYLVDNGGVASCLNAVTGELHWRRRISEKVYASPLYADGRIYILAASGTTHVIAPGAKMRELAVNELSREEAAFASMAVAGRSLFIRTESRLFRIEERSEAATAQGR
jgi:outer membrane protein assembly factor BamB